MSEWISVNDKLPEYGVTVLFAGYEKGKAYPYHCLGNLEPNGIWYDIGIDNWDRVDNVTHWMPLPELPGEGEAGEN